MCGGGCVVARYVASKSVAEAFMAAATAQGVPTTVFRPAFISNHSQSGHGNPTDYLNRYLAGCVQVGRRPATRVVLGLVEPPSFVLTRWIRGCSSVQRLVARLLTSRTPCWT